jgi:hypothetical protein
MVESWTAAGISHAPHVTRHTSRDSSSSHPIAAYPRRPACGTWAREDGPASRRWLQKEQQRLKRGVWGGVCGAGCVGRGVWGGVCGAGCVARGVWRVSVLGCVNATFEDGTDDFAFVRCEE